MIQISIRPLTPDDMALFWPLRIRALREHPDAFGSSAEDVAAWTDEFRQSLVDSRYFAGANAIFGAFNADTLVGVTGVVRETSAKMHHRCDIWGVYVSPEIRGQGVAAALFDAATAYIRTLSGVLQVHLAVATHNQAAITTYERAGFVRWGTEPRALLVDGQPVDEDHMVLLLDS